MSVLLPAAMLHDIALEKGTLQETNDKHAVLGAEKARSILEEMGFEKVDEIEPYFGLYTKAFSNNPPKPKFYPLSEDKIQQYNKGVSILYTDQCPYIVDLVEELEDAFKNKKDKFNAKKLNNCKEAQQNGVYPYGTYCICLDGGISLYKHSTKKEILQHLNS